MAMEDLHRVLDRQLQLLEMAQQIEIKELDDAFRQSNPLILQARGLACLNLNISRNYIGLGGKSILELELDTNSKKTHSHGIRIGDIVKVEEQAPSATRNSKQRDAAETPVTGVVIKASEAKIAVVLDHLNGNLDISKKIQILKYMNRAPFKRMVQTILDLKSRESECISDIVKLCFGLQKGLVLPPAPILEYKNHSLDASQKEAVNFALGARDMALIHGPPGTGKTQTLIEIINQLVSTGSKVLVCGPSNISVDNIVERLGPYKIPMVRVGHPARLLPTVLASSLDIMIQYSDTSFLVRDIRKELHHKLEDIKKARNTKERKAIWEEIRNLRKECKEREKKCIRDILKTSQVVLCTLHGAGGSLIRSTEFDVVIVDEASQALEGQCLIPLLNAKKCILAGDHLQLPPTVKSSRLTLNTNLRDLEISLFEKLIRLHGSELKRQLVVQYRMHEMIMRYSSDTLYDSSLVAADEVRCHLLSDLPDVAETDDTMEALVFWDTQGGDFGEDVMNESKLSHGNSYCEESKSNSMEAAICQKHLANLVNAGVKPGDIALVTPYNAQRAILSGIIKPLFPDVELGSVDGFQGREKEAIILSLVRSNDNKDVGFLADERRLNVAITRPRRHLCVVGDSETLRGGGAFLKKWMDYLDEQADLRYPDLSMFSNAG